MAVYIAASPRPAQELIRHSITDGFGTALDCGLFQEDGSRAFPENLGKKTERMAFCMH